LKYKVIVENVIKSIRYLAGAMAFFLFVFIGGLRGVDLPVLLIGGAITYVVAHILGSVAAGFLDNMNRETQFEPIGEEKPDYETSIKEHMDFSQGAELPTLD
jgi:hypothetical protein